MTRQPDGRFVKGYRSSAVTEIKPGQRLSVATEIKPGQRLSPGTEFKKGQPARNKLPVGSKTVRTRNGKSRAFIKVAEPNKWQYYAVHVWEEAHGPVPKGSVVHHKDRDTLNDALSNLELQTRADHLAEHRKELVAIRVLTRSNVRKAWDPCVTCGDPDGIITPKCSTPARFSGKRFGIAGELCKKCYSNHYQRERKTNV